MYEYCRHYDTQVMLNHIRQTGKLNVMLVVKNKHSVVHTTLLAKKEIKNLWVGEKISEVLQHLSETYVDLMIIDFYLQDGTVLELLQAISGILDKQKTSILVLVPENAYALSLLAYRKGADYVILQDSEHFYLEQLNHSIQKHYAQSLIMNPHMDMSYGIIGLDRDLNINFLNDAALSYLNKQDLHALVGRPVTALLNEINPIMAESIDHSAKMALTTGQPQPIGTFKLSEIEHSLACVDLMIFPLLGLRAEISGFILNLREHTVTKIQRIESSEYDSLTGLLHREFFFKKLDKSLSYSQRYLRKCALLHIDIDGFKTINEALGHRLADELLKKIAIRLQLHIKEIDLLARVGADEFMLFLPHIQSEQESGAVAQILLNAMKTCFIIEEKTYFVSLSIGISLCPQDTTHPEYMIKFAGVALSHAKKKGRNHYQFYKKEGGSTAISEIVLTNELHQALENNEFELHLQPQVSASDYQIIGFEALIRWRHPQHGILLPVQFIPFAEKIGLINEIGRWVIYKACEYINLLVSHGYPHLVIAINISVQQFMQVDFVEEMQNILSDFRVTSNQIELEITESIFLLGKEGVLNKLEQLKQLGFNIVMDDFGTGYSSLGYLKILPLDGIKIDRAFIAELSNRDQAIISSIITLAKKMHFNTLAEGVETLEQAKLLKELGCDGLQGYLFSKALPMIEVLDFLNKKGKKDDLSNVT